MVNTKRNTSIGVEAPAEVGRGSEADTVAGRWQAVDKNESDLNKGRKIK